MKEYFKVVNIVKGKPRRTTYEKVRMGRGNNDFKKALLKWEEVHPNEKWPLVGMYVVNN
jgi:hypothetical protein